MNAQETQSNPPAPQTLDEQTIALILVRKKVINLEQLRNIVSRRAEGLQGSLEDAVVNLGYAARDVVEQALSDPTSALQKKASGRMPAPTRQTSSLMSPEPASAPPSNPSASSPPTPVSPPPPSKPLEAPRPQPQSGPPNSGSARPTLPPPAGRTDLGRQAIELAAATKTLDDVEEIRGPAARFSEADDPSSLDDQDLDSREDEPYDDSYLDRHFNQSHLDQDGLDQDDLDQDDLDQDDLDQDELDQDIYDQEDAEDVDDDDLTMDSGPVPALSEVMEIKPVQLDLAVMRSLPDRFISHHKIAVLKSSEGESRLLLATARRNDLTVVEELRFLTGREIKEVFVSTESLKRCLDFYHQTEGGEILLKAEDKANLDEAILDEETNGRESPLLRLVNAVIAEAMAREASDIHIEAQRGEVLVRFRIDGVCRTFESFPKALLAPIINRLKIMAELNIAERRLPQDGRIEFKRYSSAHDIDLRVSFVPMIHGESAVIRILDRRRSALALTRLGFDQETLNRYESAISAPYGMILHTGPTGSGKSMSLYSALNSILTPEVKVVTAEDPVEYTLPGINQLQVKPSIGLSFAAALRAFLRQDPDIILVGEIRDLETATMAVEAAMTGHLLFSTLHTNDAASSIARLAELGVKPFLVASCLVAVCAQRLIRRLCDCKVFGPFTEKETELLLSNDYLLPQGWHPKGCELCENSGYSGRTGCFELLINTEPVRREILKTSSASALREIARHCGMRTLFEDAIEKVRTGQVALEEVTRVIIPD